LREDDGFCFDALRQDTVHHRRLARHELAIGLGAAREGANVAIAAKTAEPNPKLPGTIFSAAKEIEKAGGRALPLTVDVRDEAQVRDALEKTARAFGGLDIVVMASRCSSSPRISRARRWRRWSSTSCAAA
jgi:NAD(P)-dependent dehydrogenase (short-subunit alcohol dehydrogenase family)